MSQRTQASELRPKEAIAQRILSWSTRGIVRARHRIGMNMAPRVAVAEEAEND